MCTVNIETSIIDLVVKIAQIATPAVFGVLALVLSIGQSKRDKYRIKHDLYEKRLNVFQDLQDLFDFYLYTRNLDSNKILEEEPKIGLKFVDSIRLSNFLFDKDIVKYLEYVNLQTQEYYQKTCQIETSGHGDEMRELHKKRKEIKKWFIQQKDESVELFGKYLKLNHKDSKG